MEVGAGGRGRCSPHSAENSEERFGAALAPARSKAKCLLPIRTSLDWRVTNLMRELISATHGALEMGAVRQ